MANTLKRFLSNTKDIAILTSKRNTSKQVSDYICEKINLKILSFYLSYEKELEAAVKTNHTVIIVMSPAHVELLLAFYFRKILRLKCIPPILDYSLSGNRSLIVNADGSIDWLIN